MPLFAEFKKPEHGWKPVTLIDQRILIDAPPQVIWEYIADPDKLVEWHAGYTSISVLTTQRTGVGVRRRCAVTGGGKDVIEQIVAWVEGLGYEYTIVEGGPYRSFRGRFRLQPGPDGTSVQWTVEYAPKGLLGRLRDRLSGQKQLAALMAASLRELRQQISALGLRMDDAYRARLGIQGRLNAAERAQYQRRHPAPESVATVAPPAAGSAEPVAPPPPIPPAPAPEEPIPAHHEADTEPKPPAGLREALAAQGTESLPPPPPPAQITPPQPSPPVTSALPKTAPLSAPPTDHQRPTPPRGIPAVRPPLGSEESPALARPTASADDTPPARSTPPRGVTVSPSRDTTADERPTLPPPVPKTDTGELSIWEIFGIPRPSEQDEAALRGLIEFVETRQVIEKRRQWLRRGFRRPARVRLGRFAQGLRARLSLARARVRPWRWQS
ncbi:MAG: hypothetical protein KatS3mg051_0507 [Anaerolineae bacterium]|nr:MAG: hypothetical protein KatS3mg051_0507 [Anaerolineae bacterium]